MKEIRLKLRWITVLSLVFSLVQTDAQAYIGPGAGLGMLGSLIAVGLASCVALLGVIIYPIRLLRERKKHQNAPEAPPKKDG